MTFCRTSGVQVSREATLNNSPKNWTSEHSSIFYYLYTETGCIRNMNNRGFYAHFSSARAASSSACGAQLLATTARLCSFQIDPGKGEYQYSWNIQESETKRAKPRRICFSAGEG
jgi:hypothetical protein